MYCEMRADGPGAAGFADDENGWLRVLIDADALAVRGALSALWKTSLIRGLPVVAREDAQIVLAETLNNVVEHAYGEMGGQIALSLRMQADNLCCRIEDHGAGIPDCMLSKTRKMEPIDPSDPPEGGFGWHLIRTLAQDVRYQRIGDCNRLSFKINWKQSVAD